jgi:hypothetical protein
MTTRSVVLLAALSSSAAFAQRPGDETQLVLLVGPPALVSVALDLVLLASSLTTTATTGKGRAISTIAFGGVGTFIAALCLIGGLACRSPPRRSGRRSAPARWCSSWAAWRWASTGSSTARRSPSLRPSPRCLCACPAALPSCS